MPDAGASHIRNQSVDYERLDRDSTMGCRRAYEDRRERHSEDCWSINAWFRSLCELTPGTCIAERCSQAAYQTSGQAQSTALRISTSVPEPQTHAILRRRPLGHRNLQQE